MSWSPSPGHVEKRCCVESMQVVIFAGEHGLIEDKGPRLFCSGEGGEAAVCYHAKTEALYVCCDLIA